MAQEIPTYRYHSSFIFNPFNLEIVLNPIFLSMNFNLKFPTFSLFSILLGSEIESVSVPVLNFIVNLPSVKVINMI